MWSDLGCVLKTSLEKSPGRLDGNIIIIMWGRRQEFCKEPLPSPEMWNYSQESHFGHYLDIWLKMVIKYLDALLNKGEGHGLGWG